MVTITRTTPKKVTRKSSSRERWEWHDFSRRYDAGELRIGQFAKIDGRFHSQNGFARMIAGYTEDGLVVLWTPTARSHAPARDIRMIDAETASRLFFEREVRIEKAREARQEAQIQALLEEHAGDTPEQTARNLAIALVNTT